MQNLLRGYRFLALPIRVAPVYGTILYYTRAYVAQAKSGKKQALCTSPGDRRVRPGGAAHEAGMFRWTVNRPPSQKRFPHFVWDMLGSRFGQKN